MTIVTDTLKSQVDYHQYIHEMSVYLWLSPIYTWDFSVSVTIVISDGFSTPGFDWGSLILPKLPQSKPGEEKPSLMTIVTDTLKSQVILNCLSQNQE
jgi:hypothetical protein